MTPPRALMRTVLAEPAAPAPPPPGRRDVAIAVVGVLAVLVEAPLRSDLLLPVLSVPLTVGACVGLVWRRTRPLLVLVAVFGSFTALEVVALVVGDDREPLYTSAIVLLLPYAAARWASGRAAVLGLSLVLTSAVLSVVVSGGPLADALGGFAILAATIAIAVAVRTRATSRRREVDRVRSAERVDLARDLHDTVAHHVSAIAIRAQAGRAQAATDPRAALEALVLIETEASRALDEMRAMVRVLRSDPAAYTPQPGAGDLERLAGEGGLRVEVRRGPGLDELPSAVGQAVFRIAQESVTNARRHAAGAGVVRVEVSRTDDLLHLMVTDDGGPVEARGVTGHGLVGMEERAALLGGRLAAGPLTGGGWVVRAEIPLAAHGAPVTPSTGGVPR